MALPIRALPIVENWDCHSCGQCCRGTFVMLDNSDVEQLQSQGWHDHEDFRGRPIVKRESLLGGKRVLAQKPDGSCVFLTEDQRCRIHEIFGEEAKPSVCRMFPLRLVPLDKQINLTVRFACPTAATGKGKPLQTRIKGLSRSNLVSRFATEGRPAPPISKNGKRNWRDFLHVAEILHQLTGDAQLPLVRRLVHGLRFCSLVNACNLKKLNNDEFRELMEIFKESATDNVSELFQDRRSPSRSTGFLFRQAAVHFIRSHPTFPIANSLADRTRLLFTSMRFAWGGKQVPMLHPNFAQCEFYKLEEPLGPLSLELLEPLNRYFESQTQSLQYAVGNHRLTLIDSYRTLAFGFPVAMWLLRLSLGPGNSPTLEDMLNIISTLDRAQGGSAIATSARWLGNSGKLEELIAWYAR